MTPSSNDRELAQKILNYHLLRHHLEPADCIIGLGSSDPRVAERAAELYLGGYAPLIVFTGNQGALTKELYSETEAEVFAGLARSRGVPEDALLLEKQATNTGENVRYSRQLLEQSGRRIRSAIAVQKPYMERRTMATFGRFWPELRLMVTSPQIGFDDLALPWLSERRVIEIMVGDLQRILDYPHLGFQIPQEVPEAVLQAHQELIARGYTGHLPG
jgi:uncharacterized SAM-binding protein YcdF (DUF218 family)